MYLRPESQAQAEAVIKVLQALVNHYASHPDACPATRSIDSDTGSTEMMKAVVEYVGGMTDRFAFQQAIKLLDWREADLPVGIDFR